MPFSGEVVAATADYNFNSYSIDNIISTLHNDKNDNKKNILPTRQVVGCNDDILDISFCIYEMIWVWFVEDILNRLAMDIILV